MLITMHKFGSTKTWDRYTIAINGKLLSVTVHKPKPKHRIESMRNALRIAVKDEHAQFRFIGNSRVDGKWITEWIVT